MKTLLQRYLSRSTFKISSNNLKISLRDNLLQGLKLLHISDLHIDKNTPLDEIEYLIKLINQSSCSYVLFGGDIIDCKTELIEDKLILFKNIEKPAYYVSGNHDLIYGYKDLQNIFQKCNIIFLDNSYVQLKHQDQDFILWGLSDRFSKFFRIKRDENKLIEELNSIKLPKIFLSHQPKDYKFGLQSKSLLALFGHTHGGQIYPFHYLVKLVQPFLKGVYYKDNMAIYVNSGIGSWGLKYRFLSKAEITIIEL